MPPKKEKKGKGKRSKSRKSELTEDVSSHVRQSPSSTAGSTQDFELKEKASVVEHESQASSMSSLDSPEISVVSLSSEERQNQDEPTEKETSFVKEDEEEPNVVEEIAEPKSALIEDQAADSNSLESEKIKEADHRGPDMVFMKSETRTGKGSVSVSMKTSRTIRIKGVVEGESSSDILPGQTEETPEIVSVQKADEEDTKLTPVQTFEAPKQEEGPTEEKQRRNLTPDGSPEEETIGAAGEFNPPAAKDGSELKLENDELSGVDPKRRNLDPDGPPEDMELDQSGFSKPDDADKEEIKQATDINKNAVVEHEIPAGRAATNDTDNEGDDEELPWAMYRDTKKYERPSDAEDEFSEDGELDEEPPKRNSIPELYEYLGSLDNGDTELESKHIPPPLFESEDQHHMHKGVDQTKLALAEEEIADYLEEFERHVEEEVLMIGNIGLGEVQEEERNIREEHIEYQKEQAKVQKDKKQELSAAMDRAKKHVMKVFKEKYGRVKDKEAALMRRDHRVQGQISKAFRRSENQLLKALRRRKAEVMAMYGDLVFADREFGGGKGKRWKVDWDKTHQPIQIRLKCLRSVRDKMPFGEYVLMVSLFSRLGGHVMKWSNLRGQKWGAATLPLLHEGEYYNTELKIDQSVFTVCPSKPDMRPGMVLMFELFILSGPFTVTDKVVAWGSFPICDGSFNVVEGKYKMPLLRGTIDPSVDKFQTIEEMMASDLEHWLCNLYFEIVKLPRYLMGQKEYEVELQFSSGLVSYPIRTKTGEEFVDGEQPVYGSTTDIGSIAASRVSMPNSKANSFLNLQDNNNDAKPNIKLTVEPPNKKTTRPSSAVSMSIKLQKASEISSELRQRRTSRTSMSFQPKDDTASRKLSVFGSRRSIDERSMAFTDDTDTGSGTDYNDDDVCVLKKDNGFKKVKGQPGMYYKVHQNNPVDVYTRKIFNTMPRTAQPTSRRKKKKLTHQDELKQYTYNVKSIWSDKGHMPRRGREKIQYIGRMMLAELGLSQWRKGQFWVTLFMLLVTWFMRMYLHYFGQWVLLKGLAIPINKYNFYPHTVNLNYQDTLLQARHEIGVVMMGPFSNFFLFTILVPITLMFQRFFRWFPDIITHFILAFGIQTFLDPLWTLTVDCILGRYKNTGGVEPIGDAFKLYWHFYRNYRNDDVTMYVSISMTTFLYVIIAFSTAALWYMFFVRLHNNGRLMDVYWRLHGSEDEFFLPYDLEVSNEELNYICRKSEQWRGEEGERRKVAVYDYVWEQEELDSGPWAAVERYHFTTDQREDLLAKFRKMIDECWDDPNAHGQKTGAKETTTHVSIHSIHPDGLIELHRQFLRLPDGAVIEVFGEMSMPGIDEGVKQALLKGTGFQGVSNTVKRSRSLSVSSKGSSTGRKSSLRRMSSNRLDVPV